MVEEIVGQRSCAIVESKLEKFNFKIAKISEGIGSIIDPAVLWTLVFKEFDTVINSRSTISFKTNFTISCDLISGRPPAVFNCNT